MAESSFLALSEKVLPMLELTFSNISKISWSSAEANFSNEKTSYIFHFLPSFTMGKLMSFSLKSL